MIKMAFKPQYQNLKCHQKFRHNIGRNIRTINKNREALAIANTKICLEANAEKSQYKAMSRNRNARQNYDIKVDNK